MIVVFIDDNPLLVGWVGSEIGSTIERYDPIENNWQVFGTMPRARYGLRAHSAISVPDRGMWCGAGEQHRAGDPYV